MRRGRYPLIMKSHYVPDEDGPLFPYGENLEVNPYALFIVSSGHLLV
jgi:hypothetical protein